jgi:hypothetical protein
MDGDPLLPPVAPPLSPGRMAARREQILGTLVQDKPRRLVRRRRILVLAAVTAALVGASGATAYALLRPAPITQLSAGVGCFDEASLRADVAVVRPDGLAPVDRCRQVWIDEHGDRRVPTFVACVYTSGAVAVFPDTDTGVCARLGLAEPAPGEQQQLIAFDAMHRTIRDRLAGQCTTVSQAREIVLSELRSAGHATWTVAQVPSPPADRCVVDVEFVGNQQLVNLILRRTR